MNHTNRHGIPLLDSMRDVRPHERVQVQETAVLLLPQPCGGHSCLRTGVVLWRGRWWCLGCISAVVVRFTRSAA